LGNFLPFNALPAGPLCYSQVTGVGPAVASFLVTPQASYSKLAMGPLQNLLNRTDAHHKWLAESGKGRSQLD
jgi:hypothetical protein